MHILCLFAASFIPPSLVTFSCAREVGANQTMISPGINHELFAMDDLKHTNDSSIDLVKRQSDQEFEVTNTYKRPYDAVGKVGDCTGAYVSIQAHIVTTARCARRLLDARAGFTITRREDSDIIITQVLPIREEVLFTLKAWRTNGSARDDIAIIQLQVGYFANNPMKMPEIPVTKSLKKGSEVTILSFPPNHVNKMFETPGKVDEPVSSQKLIVSTQLPANDGAIVYAGDTKIIHGVVSKYYGLTEDRKMYRYSVTVLTQTKLKAIREFMEQS